jgi:hypothetical protein
MINTKLRIVVLSGWMRGDKYKQGGVYRGFNYIIFFGSTGFEFRISHFLGRCSTT